MDIKKNPNNKYFLTKYDKKKPQVIIRRYQRPKKKKNGLS